MGVNFKKLIKDTQISTLRLVLKEALNYHYSNFTELEKQGDPFPTKDRSSPATFAIRIHANSIIKFEVQAYIIHLRRLRYFINSVMKSIDFSPPKETDLREVWNDIMTRDGVINFLGSKWAAHRSVDDPQGEKDSLHLAVLLNLEQAITMWGNGHLYLSVEKYDFCLFNYHNKVLKFINWVFDTLDKKTSK